MNVLWGSVVVVLSSLAWAGQAVALLAPSTAVRWRLMEAQDDIEPVLWVDIRAEALWDTLSLWVLVAGGVLLIADSAAWPYFGLVGGGMYLYFAGRGISTRLVMTRRGLRVGSTESVKVGVVFLAIWALTALITIVAAVATFES